MASRRLVRDIVISKRSFYHHRLISQQVSTSTTSLQWIPANGYPDSRQFSVFNKLSKQIKGEADSMSLKGYLGSRQFSIFKEFSKQIKGEADGNQKFRESVKELQEKAEGLKGAKEELKVRTKQTTEQLYKRMDGMWTEAEATAKKVSANVKEKISTTAEEVKETFGIGKQGSSDSANASAEFGAGVKDESETSFGEDRQQQSVPNDSADTVFSKFKSTMSFVSPKISFAFQKLKDAKPTDFVKKGYEIVSEELSGNLNRRKRIDNSVSPTTSSPKVERSTRTDVVVLPSKQSRWNKKWESLKEKMQSHPIFKRFSGLSEPVVTKSQEIAEDIREIWDTSDHPVVHKIQDLNESVFGETNAALSFKEIRRRDPSFSLPEFVAEVQEVVEPVLNAYLEGDAEVLKKYCCNELIERCKAERKGYEQQGIFFDKKVLHISEVDVSETKMIGDTPVIIVFFSTQQVYCVRDRHGSIAAGGKDTIHTVLYKWAMKQMDVEETGELYPVWRLMDMQQNVYQALI